MSAILIFLKAPRRGYVKTRLAHHVGSERALKVYRSLVARQWSALPPNAKVEIHYTPHDASFEMQKWLGDAHAYYPQSDGELGARLEHSIEQAFKRGAQTVTCIGGDCPLLTATHFEQAHRLLDAGHDVVFGPSEDGGYYLIAVKTPLPQLFKDIPWSTRNTLKASLVRADNLKLKVGLLETLYDIDEVSELERALANKLIEP
ncbi:TIGR04282 family arsenosugar biosynthesis glycosyltransferase [Coraliomargarita algicola]|uniref:TIGR04282 family arsenosugar biosynthesis glycosyltransferase n=1 Tax=Coraliomargarita algicola TaxID=3092156 RepID=A0ABZ0RPW3_9BACT|nr:TIGR04282 family arsenosugar biosynthesis glycosyltransferase [Coraliomargarita sp. J2-16]WPJ96785.1 TIGR04282 family arsenosugar biosynthesis glycosyltransferase [Coraliomargarita sp. J2-16]